MLSTFFQLVAVANAASVSLQFNTARTYGHDGPWQAVTVHVGGFQNGLTASSQWTTLDLFPGGYWDSFIPSPTSCSTNTSGACGAGGVWSPTKGNSPTITFQPSTSNTGGNGIFQQGPIWAQNLVIPSTVCSGGGNCIVPNSTLVSIQQANLTLPNGRSIELEIGTLALGAPSQTQDFTTGTSVQGPDELHAWNAPGYLYNSSTITSDTFSLHIGAAQLSYPGSLVFGGFDQSRAIGPATSWSSNSNPQLLDIVIDVETGGSPFNFSQAQTGLLITNTSTPGPLTVAPQPVAPYLGLPKQTCDNLARYLPIVFDSASQYYLWNTADPMYQKIIKSPAFLGFTFPPPAGTTEDVLIKIPFALLNLTLKPIASGRSSNVPYFPCMPYAPQDGVYTLGRAFLQGAMLAGNFATGISWLAQAPGPGATKNGLGSAPQIVDIAPGASTLTFVAQASDNSFNSSWGAYWTPLAGAFNSSATNTTTGNNSQNVQKSKSSGGLSTGAAVGIGVGIALLVVAVLGISVFFFLRHRRNTHKKTPSEGEPFVAEQSQVNHNSNNASQYPADNKVSYTLPPAVELGDGTVRYDVGHPYKGAYAPDPRNHGADIPLTEMSAQQDHHFELPGNHEPMEMDATTQHSGRFPPSGV